MKCAESKLQGTSWWFFDTRNYKRVLYDGDYFGNRALPMFLMGLVPVGKGKKVGKIGFKFLKRRTFKLTKEAFEHIIAGHVIGKAGKDMFPRFMSKSQIKKLIMEGAKNGKIIKDQGERILIKYKPEKFGIKEMEIWVNKITNIIETAYPTKGSSVWKF